MPVQRRSHWRIQRSLDRRGLKSVSVDAGSGAAVQALAVSAGRQLGEIVATRKIGTMRQIGTLPDERQVQRLGDYLLTQGIRIQAEPIEGGFALWAFDEDRVAQAREELARFVASPGDARYEAAEREARVLRDKLIREQKQRQGSVVEVRRMWSTPQSTPVTFSLIAISVAVWFASGFGEDFDADPVARKLVIAEFRPAGDHRIAFEGLARGWPEHPGAERTGFQAWRLLTPIFLHLGPMHLLMNMLALHSLGRVIEFRRGSLRILLLVLVTGVISNIVQYELAGPAFGGMSGAIFGLFGYAWMKSEFDHSAGIFIPRMSVVWMLGWLFLCMYGYLGPIANGAHFGGLIVGILISSGPIVMRRILGR
jgi:rhomboid protease GlpG